MSGTVWLVCIVQEGEDNEFRAFASKEAADAVALSWVIERARIYGEDAPINETDWTVIYGWLCESAGMCGFWDEIEVKEAVIEGMTT